MTPRPPRSSSRRPAPSSPSSKFAYFGLRAQRTFKGSGPRVRPLFVCVEPALAARTNECAHRVRANLACDGPECKVLLGVYRRVRASSARRPALDGAAEKCGRPPGRCREVQAAAAWPIGASQECGRFRRAAAAGARFFSAPGVECAHRVPARPHSMTAAEKCGRPPDGWREVRAASMSLSASGSLAARSLRRGTIEPPHQGSSRNNICAGRLSERENILENGTQVKAFR